MISTPLRSENVLAAEPSLSRLSVSELIDRTLCTAASRHRLDNSPLCNALVEAGMVDCGFIYSPAHNESSPFSAYDNLTSENDFSISNRFSCRENIDGVNVFENNGNHSACIARTEFSILMDSGLRPEIINDRICFIRGDIDINFKDAIGRTNLERMSEGLSPLDSVSGRPVELHHVGQQSNGPLAELRMEEHRIGPNNLALHPVRFGSEVEHGAEWFKQKSDHWTSRSQLFVEVLN